MSAHTAEAIALIHNRPGFAREVARQLGFTHVKDKVQEPVLSAFGLTSAQRNLLGFIEEYVEANGITPSYGEMMVAMDLKSKSGIHRIVTALEERGHLFRLAGRARSITLRAA